MYDEILQEDVNKSSDYDKNIVLLRKLKNGNEKALDEIVVLNSPLVMMIARKYTGRGCDIEDLLQLGNVGLIKAARNYNESYGVKFSTYAVPLIMGEIKRFLRDDGIIKVSRSLCEASQRVARAREEYVSKNQCEPEISYLAKRCALSNEDVIQALECSSPMLSLNVVITDDGSCTLGDIIADVETDKNEQRLLVSELLDTLNDTDRKIILLRYFNDLTQTKTAERCGMSQVQVSRREREILSRLRSKVV